MKIQLKLAEILMLTVILFVTGCCKDLPSTPQISPRTYAIGNIGPSGVGIVFFITDGGLHGLEAAPPLWNGGADPIRAWEIPITHILAGTSTAIGTGYANTYTCMTGAVYVAAAECRAYTGGGKTDWFLPSKDELSQLYLQKDSVGGFAAQIYWSSSEFSLDKAWYLDFANGALNWLLEDSLCTVRPVRAF